MNEHFQKVMEQLKQGPTIGTQGTPVVSFWPMRDKWKKFGDYWEQWGTDGPVTIPTEKNADGWRRATGVLMAPAELKLIYFVIPGTDTVCQLAYEHDPAEPETGATANRRYMRTREVLSKALEAVKRAG